ncbi:hypothetical protein LRAMOSA01794 [Lichtheimia ramosa]|uniref:Uncharacterized protein n=1 Tax=Lichtheimia ramosa TaxID=688394 RepID=A0A077WKC0_9FUNG|nr:hypothetical protein LRAMOSA01794 [Lichtheimia ramosa]
MFGRKPKNQTLDNSQPFDIGDIDELLNATIPEADTDANDTDLNDPELLQQLQELTSSNRATNTSQNTQQRDINKKTDRGAKQKQSAMETDDFDIEQYAALAQGTTDDVQVELDEKDLQDPTLLNALAQLGEEGNDDLSTRHTMAEQQHHSSTQPAHESIQHLVAMGFSETQANDALDKYDGNLERATNYLLDTPMTNNDQVEADVSANDKAMMDEDTTHRQTADVGTMEEEIVVQDEQFNDLEELQQRIKHYQKLAIAAKRSGDKKKAVELLRHSKGLDQRYQELIQRSKTSSSPPSSTAQVQDDIMDDTPVATESPSQTNSSTPVQPSTSPPPPPSAEPAQPKENIAATPETTRALLQQIVALQKEYKEAAIHYKNIGNLAASKEMIRTSKELLRIGIQVKNGEIADIEAVRNKLPQKPDMSRGDGKMRQIQMVASGSPSEQTLEHLESQLVYQVDVCHNLAIQSTTTTGRKQTGKTLSDSANAYQQLEQAFTADLVSIRSRRDQDMKTTPQLHYELVNYTYKNILDHIPINQMELKIIKGIGLQSLDISTNIEPFVTWDFGGWPPENTAQASLGKGETAVQKGTEPEFDASILIPITRGNRIFMRYIQRRKLTLEVFHNRYSYGLFRRPLSLGKVSLPLETLLNKCSISGAFDLIDSNRRKTGGKLEIQLNLREPLSGEDIVRRAERWLVIDEFGQDTSSLLASSGLTPIPYQSQQTLAESPSTITPAPGGTPSAAAAAAAAAEPPSTETMIPSEEKTKKQTSSKQQPETNAELEQAEEEYNSVDHIVSNMVLEHELSLVNNALAGKLSAQAKEELMDRKQALDIKMNMLVIQVQTGLLDMDTYLQNTRKRLERDRQLALIFKKHNRLDIAKGALTRKKIMQDEIEEAEAAMATQNEE